MRANQGLLSSDGTFWRKVSGGDVATCWVWGGGRNPGGYGQAPIKVDGRWKAVAAHRLAYQMLRSDIEPDMHLDHLCENPPCVNPWHLEEVTPGVNMQRASLRGRLKGPSMDPARAPRGHSFGLKPGYRLAFDEIEKRIRAGLMVPGEQIHINLPTTSRRALIAWLTKSGLAVERQGTFRTEAYVADSVPEGPLVATEVRAPTPTDVPQHYPQRAVLFRGDPGVQITLPSGESVWASTEEYDSLGIEAMWTEIRRCLTHNVR